MRNVNVSVVENFYYAIVIRGRTGRAAARVFRVMRNLRARKRTHDDNVRIGNTVLHAVALHAQWRLSLLLSFAARKKVDIKIKNYERAESKSK